MPSLNVLETSPQLYFANRLATLRRSQQLTAGMQFNLASSPLSDDELDEVTSVWGGEGGATGFGFAEAMRDMLSKEPKRVPVSDIKTLQDNLVRQGYAPPEALTDGNWTPEWYPYFRRWDRDNYDKVLAGKHWGSVPMESGLRLISNTLPSKVWQGLLGAAKGLQTQAFGTGTVEGSLERLGAIGGAAGGAAIGTIIAPGVGTAIGAGVGAAVGFFADLFGEDPAEVDQTSGERLLDALSPFEEYADQGWRAFWTDLGFIGTAASLAAGAKLGAQGVGAVLGGIRGTAGAINTAQAAGASRIFSVGAGGAAETTEFMTGQALPKLSVALARPATAQPGFVTRLVAGATEKFVPGTGKWLTQEAIKYGPAAQMARPAFQIVNKAYTGLATASIGARLSAGFDAGTRSVGQTPIEKAIVETDPLESGVSIPFLGDAVDWASFFLVPERFLPFKAGTIGGGARRLMGDVAAWPWIHAVQSADPTMTGAKARGWVQNDITADLNTYARLDYGIHTEAVQIANRRGVDYGTARAGVVRQIHKEAEAAAPDATVVSPLASELVRRSSADPEKFAAWLVDLPGEGVGKFQAYKETAARARQATRDVRSGRYLVTETPQAFVASSSGLEVAGIRGQGLEIASLKVEAENLAKLLKRRTAQLHRTMDPGAARRLDAEVRQLTDRKRVVDATLKEAAEAPPQVQELNVMAARQDFMTRKDLFGLRDQYNQLRQEVESTFEGDLTEAHRVARQKLSIMLHDMAAQGFIPDKLMLKAIEGGARPGDEVAKFLEKAAQKAARDVTLSADDMAYFAQRGYKPVVTGEDVLQLDEIPEIMQVFGVGNYTRRANFFESLGISGRFVKEENQFAMKLAHERAELEQVFQANELPLNGQQALTRLHEYLKAQNREGVVWGPLLKKMRGRPHMPYVDTRQLTPEDLIKVFEDVPGFTEEHAFELMGALKRGSSLGADVQFRNPVASARALGRTMRVAGLPGFADYVRTLKFPVPPRALSAAAGGIAGAVAGGLTDDNPLMGAAIGAAAGLGYGQAARRSYGYLPDALARMNLALRYTFSLTFDMGRYSEAGMIGAAKYGLPIHFAPRRALTTKAEGWKTPYSADRVKGEEAWNHAIQFQDELNGTVYFGGLEDTERRVFQAGLLGFKPRDFEAMYGFELYQRGWSMDKIKDAVANINRYGVGRTVGEKTANFVFFPFSFSKKLLTSLGDFILQAPGRNLLLTEGLRRYHDSSLDERFNDLIQNHLPILEQLSQVNNLVYGISPGRFFLEGLTDHRSAAGWVGQILSSILVPGGAATQFAVASGQAGDLAMNAFIPVVITGESLDRAGGVQGLDDIIRRYVPLVREIDQYAVQGEGGVFGGAIGEQVTAVTSPTHETPYAQLTGYLDEIRAFKDDLEPLALATGYTSVDGLMASDIGAGIGLQYDQLKNDLRLKYPQGWAMVSQIDNTSLIDEAALNDIASQVADGQGSKAEEDILLLRQEAVYTKGLNAQIGMPSDVGNALLSARIRTMAKKHLNDPRFLELYRRFFEREYGPIEVTFA